MDSESIITNASFYRTRWICLMRNFMLWGIIQIRGDTEAITFFGHNQCFTKNKGLMCTPSYRIIKMFN